MKALSSVFVALALLASSGAVLADRGHDDHGQDRGHAYADRHDRIDRDDHRDRDDRHRDGPRDYRQDGRRYTSDRYDRGYRYYPAPRRWARGGRYDGPMYIVNNYGYYRLAPPPYGYRWVRNEQNYLLVSIGDNMILDVAIR